MRLLRTNIGDVRPLPVVRVELPSVVVDIVSVGIVIQEIVVLFHSILVTPSWGTLRFFFLSCRGRTTCSLSAISSVVSPGFIHSSCALYNFYSLLMKVMLDTLVSSIGASICAVWTFSAYCPIFG